MRTSRLLARRIAIYESMLQGATTDEERRRIVAAIRRVRGEAMDRLRALQPRVEEFVPEYVRSRTRSQRKRGAA